MKSDYLALYVVIALISLFDVASLCFIDRFKNHNNNLGMGKIVHQTKETEKLSKPRKDKCRSSLFKMRAILR